MVHLHNPTAEPLRVGVTDQLPHFVWPLWHTASAQIGSTRGDGAAALDLVPRWAEGGGRGKVGPVVLG